MTTDADARRRGAVTVEYPTDGMAALPARLTVATLTLRRRWWALLFVVVPVGLLAASLWISPRFAEGIVGICGFLALTLWGVSYATYDDSRIRIDPATRTLAVAHGNAELERSVDLDRVASVSVRPLGSMALVRIESHSVGRLERSTLSDPFLVPTDRLSAVLDALRAANVTVPEAEGDETGAERHRTEPSEPTLRLVATLLALVGVPLCALVAFGRAILFTDGAAIVAVLGAVALVRELS